MGQPSVARSLFRGLVAGVAGTAAMTAAQLVAAKLRGQDGGTPVPESWEDAPAPAQVAKKGAAALGEGDRIRTEHVPALTNAMHWAYGVGWGAVYGLAARRARPTPVAGAAALGGGIWAAQYAELVPLGISPPPWELPPQELALDLSFHAVYAGAVAAAYAALT